MLSILAALNLIADDVGITPARLLELPDGGYALEADVPPQLVAAIRPPVVPERFTLAEKPSYRRLGAGLVVRYDFGGSDQALVAGDTIFLPWARSAVLLTARWADGTADRAMFPRSPAGITVFIDVLRPVPQTPFEVARRNLATALGNPSAMFLRILVLLGLALAIPAGRRLASFTAFFAGHALAMPAIEIGVPTLSTPLAGGLMAIGAAVMARTAVKGDLSGAGRLLVVLGLVDGLGIAGRVAGSGAAAGDVVPGLFGAALGVDLALVAVATGLAASVGGFTHSRVRTVSAVVVGSLAIACLIGAVASFPSGTNPVLDPADQMAAARLDLRSGTAPGTGGSQATAPRRLDDSAMVFLTVEPLEVRVEVLLSLRDFLSELRIQGGPGDVVPVETQKAVADRALRLVGETLGVTIDNREAVALLERTDFVTVAATGVATRTEPQPELLATSVLGVTLVYGVDRPPGAVDLRWSAFPTPTTEVPVVWTDPTGSDRSVLTLEVPTTRWSNSIASFQPAPVEAVTINPPQIPLYSLVIVAAAAIWWLRSRRSPGPRWGVVAAIVLAAVIYPFGRTSFALAGIAGRAPSKAAAVEITDELLTNVYHAFDFRDEETIYDRLAVTVTGDKLSDIYLENRRALELENRGGARAKVDDVEVLEIQDVRRDGDGGFRIDAVWEVSGSVNHFGHVHYRQNRYDAALFIVAVDGAWKLRDIEILDERRIL